MATKLSAAVAANASPRDADSMTFAPGLARRPRLSEFLWCGAALAGNGHQQDAPGQRSEDGAHAGPVFIAQDTQHQGGLRRGKVFL